MAEAGPVSISLLFVDESGEGMQWFIEHLLCVCAMAFLAKKPRALHTQIHTHFQCLPGIDCTAQQRHPPCFSATEGLF